MLVAALTSSKRALSQSSKRIVLVGPRGNICDNTLSPPHPVGGRASKTVPPGSPVGEYPPRKETPKSTHARRRPGEGAPSDKLELCDRKFTCLRRRPRGDTHASPSYPIRSPRTLGKPSSDTLKGPTESPPSGPTWLTTRRTAEASNTALSRGGGKGAT